MRLLPLVYLLLLVATSCQREKEFDEVVSDSEAVSTEQSLAPSYDEVWMMRGWQGYMGMVLGLKDGEFHYWFYSDAEPALQWAKGMYHRDTTEIRLKVSHDPSLEDPPVAKPGAVLGKESIQTDSIYNNTWRIVHDDDGVFLASVNDLANKRDSGRWLRSVDPRDFAKFFPDGGPFVLHMNPQLEGEQDAVLERQE